MNVYCNPHTIAYELLTRRLHVFVHATGGQLADRCRKWAVINLLYMDMVLTA